MNFETTEFFNKNGEKIIIPAGFAVSRVEGENIIDDGLVIIDSKGNEFVWIKVPKIKEIYGEENLNLNFMNENDYNIVETKLKQYVSSYKDDNYLDEYYYGSGLTAQKYLNLYNSMLKSIYENEGFWIGRYETGIEGTSGETTEEILNMGRKKSRWS